MTATVEGLTARLDVIAWILDEHRTPAGERPMWVDAFTTIPDDELHLVLMTAIVTAAELVQRSCNQRAVRTSAQLLAMADLHGAALDRLRQTAVPAPAGPSRPDADHRVTWRDVRHTMVAWVMRRHEGAAR